MKKRILHLAIWIFSQPAMGEVTDAPSLDILMDILVDPYATIMKPNYPGDSNIIQVQSRSQAWGEIHIQARGGLKAPDFVTTTPDTLHRDPSARILYVKTMNPNQVIRSPLWEAFSRAAQLAGFDYIAAEKNNDITNKTRLKMPENTLDPTYETVKFIEQIDIFQLPQSQLYTRLKEAIAEKKRRKNYSGYGTIAHKLEGIAIAADLGYARFRDDLYDENEGFEKQGKRKLLAFGSWEFGNTLNITRFNRVETTQYEHAHTTSIPGIIKSLEELQEIGIEMIRFYNIEYDRPLKNTLAHFGYFKIGNSYVRPLVPKKRTLILTLGGFMHGLNSFQKKQDIHLEKQAEQRKQVGQSKRIIEHQPKRGYSYKGERSTTRSIKKLL